jgi:hypothetical protein
MITGQKHRVEMSKIEKEVPRKRKFGQPIAY